MAVTQTPSHHTHTDTIPAGWLLCIGICIAYMIPYMVANHLPLHRAVVPFLFHEDLIPFMPWTFIIYISVYAEALIVMRTIPARLLKRALPLFALMTTIAIFFFLFFPVEYPRMLYTSTNHFVSIFRITDGPGNCFPSLHVATTIFFAGLYSLKQGSNWEKALMWLWTIAVIISVLTTKQHYVIDVIGGIVLAVPFVWFIKNRIPIDWKNY
jgi:membrane-associated phospholipid phosphatase